MSRFKRLSHVIWCCKYHIVWVPKYRFRILTGPLAEELKKTIHVYCGRMGCEVIELNIQSDHVHLFSIDATERVGIETVRDSERKNCDTGISPISAFKAEAVLGESFLGKRLLR